MKRIVWYVLFVMVNTILAQEISNCPCCTENHYEFDFWIGEWEVTNAKGDVAGKNTIAKEENGCVLRENWTSARQGYTGTSINFYNSATRQWEQLWVDNSGASLKLKGNRQGDRMVMTSADFVKDDKKLRNRITWFKNEDGTVRQLWEVVEGDRVVSVLFDGMYRRK